MSKKVALADMNLEEITAIAVKLKLEVPADFDADQVVHLIKSSGKYNQESVSTDVEEIADGNRKPHKVFGEYIKIKCFPTQNAQQGAAIFVSVNEYTAEFQPNTVVSLPEDIVKFLEQASVPEHYYDATKLNSAGQPGAHLTRDVEKYIVSKV